MPAGGRSVRRKPASSMAASRSRRREASASGMNLDIRRHQPHAQLVEQLPVHVGLRIRRRQQLIAHEDRIRAGQKTQRLRLIR